MGDPYTDVSISGYNSNPPPDDGSTGSDNEIDWSMVTDKVGDPLNTAVQALNTNIGSAVDKMSGGITSTGTNYTVLSTDQGKCVKCTAAVTITTPDATSVGAPFRFAVVNISSGDVTIDGSGSQTIDGLDSITIPAGAGVELDTDGSNWFTRGQNFASALQPPQGYLTLVSGTPVILTDQTAKTAVYYALDTGNLVPIPNGTTFKIFEITELTLTLASQHTANNIFDVYIFEDPDNPGSIVIGTGPAWTTATAGSGARGTGAGTAEITRLLGVVVNNVEITARNGATTYTVAASSGLYVGSLYMDGTNGQISCHVSYGQSRKWGVWNMYNRKPIRMKMGDGTASWAYNTATIHESRGQTTNTIAVFQGLAQEIYEFDFLQVVGQITNDTTAAIGVGLNSTTAFSGYSPSIFMSAGSGRVYNLHGKFTTIPSLGLNNVNALELATTQATTTFYGTEANMLFTATYRG